MAAEQAGAGQREVVQLAARRPVRVQDVPSPIPVGKAGWRAFADAQLRALTPPVRKMLVATLVQEILALAQKMDVKLVGIYHPIGAEIETRELANTLLAQGLLLAYPRVRPDGSGMDFVPCPGPHGLQPRPRSRLMEPPGPACAPTDLDLLVVPCVALSGGLVRLGHGAGYFDRYLPQLSPRAPCVGVLPQCCVLPWQPIENHDKSLHLVCTQAGLFGPA